MAFGTQLLRRWTITGSVIVQQQVGDLGEFQEPDRELSASGTEALTKVILGGFGT